MEKFIEGIFKVITIAFLCILGAMATLLCIECPAVLLGAIIVVIFCIVL